MKSENGGGVRSSTPERGAKIGCHTGFPVNGRAHRVSRENQPTDGVVSPPARKERPRGRRHVRGTDDVSPGRTASTRSIRRSNGSDTVFPVKRRRTSVVSPSSRGSLLDRFLLDFDRRGKLLSYATANISVSNLINDHERAISNARVEPTVGGVQSSSRSVVVALRRRSRLVLVVDFDRPPRFPRPPHFDNAAGRDDRVRPDRSPPPPRGRLSVRTGMPSRTKTPAEDADSRDGRDARCVRIDEAALV